MFASPWTVYVDNEHEIISMRMWLAQLFPEDTDLKCAGGPRVEEWN